MGSPLTFKAGGKSRSSRKSKHSSSSDHIKTPKMQQQQKQQPSPSSRHQHPTPTSLSKSNALTIIQTGLSSKRSPFQIKNWIACVLTLDGRDKFTKVLQYGSRLLCWYFAGLSKQLGDVVVGASTSTSSISSSLASNNIIATSNVLAAVTSNLQLRQMLYSALSIRFNSLYKSLVTSRKAFRLGRFVIEMDKLKSMGWGDYLGYMMMHPLAGGVADGATGGDDGGDGVGRRGTTAMSTSSSHTLERYDTHPIPEEEEGHDDDDDDDRGDELSWGEDSVDDDDGGFPSEEKKLDRDIPKKVASRPGRPKLPSRISSNVGWGPSTTTTSNDSPPSKKKKTHVNLPPARTVSEIGRRMYQPFPSRSSSMGSYKQVKEISSNGKSTSATSTPTWKIVGGTIKLLGLMGFWAFDNLSFLTSSGFLDPIRLQYPSSGSIGTAIGSDDDANINEYRMKRKKGLSIRAVQCYFFGVVAGLYVNARALWSHRNGVLGDARNRLEEAIRLSTTRHASTTSLNNENNNSDHDEDEDAVKEARNHLQQTEQKHFELSLALLKSCCDFMVFSNNPGIDLHLKLRGRKNHEGLHCLGGLVSAGTVLYNNFPNAK